jgi:D-glycero-beta-D-manno-heptose-7-phosphate kinase
VRVLVIGDSCKDIFVYGKCDRLAPASPVPVFVPLSSRENRGMAGNVYENLLSLHPLEVDLVTNETEITKTRYVHELTNHMFVRVDSGEAKIERIKNIKNIKFTDYAAVIISDYNKGFLTEGDIETISNCHPLVFMDTKKLLGPWAQNINFIKINEEEYNKTRHLLEDTGWFDDKLIVTMGSKGCVYRGKTYPVKKVEIKDLTGAGDSFLTGFVYKFLETKNIDVSLTFANECATKVVQQKGVNTINDI